MTKKELIKRMPLMQCANSTEFKQRLQWLSEGMLENHLKSIINYVPSQTEIALFKEYTRAVSKLT
jgi:hypothetical protein